MRLDELKPAPGSKHRPKIVGRGIGSGHGAQSTRGMKGQRSRAGWGGMTGFEGGQIPMIRRIPKRGFRNTAFQLSYSIINTGELEARFPAQTVVSPESLLSLRLVKKGDRLKVLGDGDITKPMTIHAHAFSASALEKIKKAGGKTELLKK